MRTDAPRLLVLAGTTEARQLVEHVAVEGGWHTITSFAGRTSTTLPVPGAVRRGGFGGIAGLEAFLVDEHIDAVVDATHPFAAVMPHHVHKACCARRVPALRLLRPPWEPQSGDRWTNVESVERAAQKLGTLGVRRVLLTTGRQELQPFAALGGMRFVIRTIEAIDPALFDDAVVLRDRGPFDVVSERALLEQHAIELVVTKNSGAAATGAKLVAARQLGLPVLMVERPPSPPARTMATVEEARRWLSELQL